MRGYGPMLTIVAVGPNKWAVWREMRLQALEEAPDAFGSAISDWVDAPEDRWRGCRRTARSTWSRAWTTLMPKGQRNSGPER